MIRVCICKERSLYEKHIVQREDKDIKDIASEKVANGKVHCIHLHRGKGDHQFRERSGNSDKDIANKGLTESRCLGNPLADLRQKSSSDNDNHGIEAVLDYGGLRRNILIPQFNSLFFYERRNLPFRIKID